MKKIIKNNLPIVILAFIAIIICFKNYAPGTILSGWDTLHPEFNFGLAIKREIFGVFRTYQGLGAVAAHSDMADLPRIILLILMSPFIPMSFLRYFYIFLTLILGPIGMYFFLKRVVFSKTPKESTIPSYFGALFYLLNLGTMQQFIVPFEMFTTQYASLPWLFLSATEYLNTKTHQKKMLILFVIATFFSVPMAYTPTLWYIYFITFISYLSVLTLIRIRNKEFSIVKKTLTLILLTLLVNSFWILPNVYFVFNHASEVTKANINQMFSPQAFLYNKEFGNIKNIAGLKSFLFDWNVYAANNHFTQLLHPWIQHLKQPFVEPLGYLFAFVSLCGIIYSIFKRNKILIGLLPLLFLCLFFLFNDNSPTYPLYNLLRTYTPLFQEAFRFPADKVLGIFTFVFAIYFAFGQFLLARVSKRIKHAQIIIFAALIFYFMLPAFKGYFISPYMRIKIPDYYFEMFKWFDKEPQDGRIANLPIHSLWGWEYYDWPARRSFSEGGGFQGAGFIWFGIKQPLLARDFDRWSPYNEQYYREMSYAIYSQNEEGLKIVLEKYNIKYVLLDKSIIAPQNNSKVLLHKETEKLLGKQPYIQKIKEFGNTLSVYKVKSKNSNTSYLVQNLPYVYPKTQVFYEDVAYKDYGNYITKKGGIYYPLLNLIDNQSRVLPNTLKITQEGVVIRLPKDGGMDFTLPSYLDTQDSILADVLVEKNQNELIISLYPYFPTLDIQKRPVPIITKSILPQIKNITLTINKKNALLFNIPTDGTPLSLGTILLNTKKDNTIALYPSDPNETILPDLSTIKYYIEPCENQKSEKVFGIETAQGNSFYIFGKNVSLCMTITLSEIILKNLKTSEALLNVTFNYKSNLPLKFCLAELINGACQNYSDNRLNQYFGLRREDLQDLGLKFQLDTTNSDSIEKAFYSNLILNLTNPFFTKTLAFDSVSREAGSRSAGKNSLGSIHESLPKRSTLILPYSSNKQLSQDITKLPKTNGFCPNTPFSNSPLIKKQILENNNDRFMRYESIDGLSCDHFSYQNLSQNEAYLVAITSKNVKGLPSTLCITNAVSRHCDIYTTLSSHKDFNTDIFLLPPQIKNENGFDVNIGNLGIKKSPSINDLKSIEIIPFPYKWLAQIKTVTMKQPASLQGGPNNEAMNNLLVLPQSFEKGWKAYQVKSSKFKVQSWANTVFPFMFGKELKDHVLVNSWANGWILNSGTMKQSNNETIVILFLPQYLEYLGFLLLLGTAAWLTFVYRPTRTKLEKFDNFSI